MSNRTRNARIVDPPIELQPEPPDDQVRDIPGMILRNGRHLTPPLELELPDGENRLPRNAELNRHLPWCKILSIVVLIVVVLPTIWYIHSQFCSTHIMFTRVESDISNLKKQMRQIKGTDSSSTCGKSACNIEGTLSSSQSSAAEEDCCDAFESSDELCSGGRPDFALESSGGMILGTCDTQQIERGSSTSSVFGIPICCSRNGPSAVIQANNQPGECWAFRGCQGTVIIKLLGYVFISGVTLEHIPKSISPSGNINSAPNDFCIVGMCSQNCDKDGDVLGQFSYDIDGPPTQYFSIKASDQSYEVVQMQIHSNHGNPDFTCVYRLQVHGKLDQDLTLGLDGQ